MRAPMIYLETTIFNFPFADNAPQYRDDTLRLFVEIKARFYAAGVVHYQVNFADLYLIVIRRVHTQELACTREL